MQVCTDKPRLKGFRLRFGESQRLPGLGNWGLWWLPTALLLAGCGGQQSALAPAGREAAQLANLFWWMTAGAAAIWIGVAALTVYAIRVKPDPAKNARRGQLMIVLGGGIIPTVVLGVLLAFGLAMLPGLVARAPEGSLRISVIGELWWWRVVYERADGRRVELANEIRLPVGETVQFDLYSSNVIHAFWIPSVGGKRDMIPGRVTHLALTPTKMGVFRGACAEYCGTSHALMNFYVEVTDKEAFERWLEEQANPAATPAGELASRGAALFLANGCGACHAVRGTEARGVVGPDLTHFGSRFSLGAGILTNDTAELMRWVSHPRKIKPGAHMPAFQMLPEPDREAIAAYLTALK